MTTPDTTDARRPATSDRGAAPGAQLRIVAVAGALTLLAALVALPERGLARSPTTPALPTLPAATPPVAAVAAVPLPAGERRCGGDAPDLVAFVPPSRCGALRADTHVEGPHAARCGLPTRR